MTDRQTENWTDRWKDWRIHVCQADTGCCVLEFEAKWAPQYNVLENFIYSFIYFFLFKIFLWLYAFY